MLPCVSWLAFAVVPTVVAQTSADSNCTDKDYNWVFNSDGQSPCRVAEILADACDLQGFLILPLDSGATYPGPTKDENNHCHCNTVLYSLMSACAACQDRSWITLTEYAQNCTSFTHTYPGQIPSGTSVPSWAYLDVTATNDTFNVSAAIVDDPTKSDTWPPDATETYISPGFVASGAIIGSVGSITGLLALLITLLLWKCGKFKLSNDAARRSPETGERVSPTAPPRPFPLTSPPQLSLPTTVYSGDPGLFSPHYNPDDPTTFPPEVS